MLTEDEVLEALDRFTYKPQWNFEYYLGTHEGPHIIIRTYQENSYKPGEYLYLDIHSSLPPMRTVENLFDWLLWRLKRIEIHETLEWAKVDGKPWVDPHRPNADRDW